eukprot:CAMPEP_0118894182 /NCGR_PEP_ID=MMETSP1166-20130328/3073_1 /TAXON_ID=1104430 /ORGANISM="Chrysoreinhardia sp, Strain CCMP3193" /LENGTH=399 /DNA_ID=CAMNT_0006833069 /DNA_START=512 /DNA_END=1711 /DNA_ORIENTATION=+
MGIDGERISYFSWPVHTTNTQKHKDLAQIVPPHATAALMLALHTQVLEKLPPNLSNLLEDVYIPLWDPNIYLRKMADRYIVNDAVPYIEPMTKQVYWLNDGSSLLLHHEKINESNEGAELSEEGDTSDTDDNNTQDQDLDDSESVIAQAATSTESPEEVKTSGEETCGSRIDSRLETGFPWRSQPYEYEHSDLPWIGLRCDERGNPLPLHPPHLPKNEQNRVTPPTAEELDKAMDTIGVTSNKELNKQDKLMLRHMVAYSWATFDDTMRAVDGVPVSLKFKDKDQQPIKLSPYRLAPAKIECLKKQITQWEKDGILRKGSSASPWAFPALLLPKKGGTPGTADAFRLVVDFRALNRLLEDGSYPLPHQADAVTFLCGKRYRSTLDMRWGYHNISLSEGD